MARTQSKGKCRFCERAFTNSGMARHLGTCKEREKRRSACPSPESRSYHIAVKGRYQPEYWMHLDVRGDATLRDLDAFLRTTWLECCGHLSAFTIAGEQYMPNADIDPDSQSMDVAVEEVLRPGMDFRHEYDFGTTTDLSLKVVAQWEGGRPDEPVELLARNDAPAIPCESCGRPATQVCGLCIFAGEGWLCDDCADGHDCDEEMLLPVVNSPRVGMCGYTG